ncbi:MAG: F0F1 ATP synthase subunit B [Alphaproteobacteria bacterium]|nr:F0F1 ATP synthase subunit B [Alphaproteobacteria bacterium]
MEMLHEPEFWVAVGFLLVIALLVWKGVPGMVARMLDQRAAVISAELDEAKRLRAEAAALLADYQKRAAGAEAEARAIVDAATAEAAQFQKDSRIALEAQIQRRTLAAQDKIAQAEAAALNEIRSLAADHAVNAAQKLIAARLDDSRASSLIAESIKGVGEKLS